MTKPAEKSMHSDRLIALEKEKAELYALFSSIGEGAIVTDTNGNISRINDVALEMLGYKRADMLGKWFPDAVVAADELGRKIPNIERPITEAFLSGRPVYRRLSYRKKDGSYFMAAITVAPVLHDGNPVGAIEIFRDVTSDVQLERAKDEFISIASHELRTPATIVKQYMGMMLEGYVGELNEQQLEMLKNAYESNERQLAIINNMLQVARAEADKISIVSDDVNIITLTTQIINEQQAKFADLDHEVSFVHSGIPSRFHTDSIHLRMIIENLLSNAHKYTPAGKPITITLTAQKGVLTLSVKDSGVGISKEDLAKLFQKFSRIDNPLGVIAGGSGLGLFWVKKLVVLHGGDITVHSRLGRGSTFVVNLPAQRKTPLGRGSQVSELHSS